MKPGRGSSRYGSYRVPHANGYIRVWKPGHPVANGDGYALEHRYVLYEAGVELPDGMYVHHRNGDKTDNRIENLEVKAAADHTRDHTRGQGHVVNQYGTYPFKTERPCETCGRLFMPWTSRGRFCSRECSNRRSPWRL